MPIEKYTNDSEILAQDLANLRGLIKILTTDYSMLASDPVIKSLERLIRFMGRYDNNDDALTTIGLYENLDNLQSKVGAAFATNRVVTADNITRIFNELLVFLYQHLDYTVKSNNTEEIND